MSLLLQLSGSGDGLGPLFSYLISTGILGVVFALFISGAFRMKSEVTNMASERDRALKERDEALAMARSCTDLITPALTKATETSQNMLMTVQQVLPLMQEFMIVARITERLQSSGRDPFQGPKRND